MKKLLVLNVVTPLIDYSIGIYSSRLVPFGSETLATRGVPQVLRDIRRRSHFRSKLRSRIRSCLTIVPIPFTEVLMLTGAR